MQDNFNMHDWRLNRALKEIDETTFTSKHDDNPGLKGGQKDLPDELQAGILKKEGEENELEKHERILYQLQNMNRSSNPSDESTKRKKIEDLKKKISKLKSKVTEGEDHEVSMAHNSLQSIISSASQLMNKLGDDERDIPGWIQDHITNAENYIDQANQGFHELEPSVKDIDAMDMVTEEVSANKKIKAKNALAIHLRSAMEDGNKENIEQVKDARDRINNTKSVDELVNILGEFGYKDDEIEDILG